MFLQFFKNCLKLPQASITSSLHRLASKQLFLSLSLALNLLCMPGIWGCFVCNPPRKSSPHSNCNFRDLKPRVSTIFFSSSSSSVYHNHPRRSLSLFEIEVLGDIVQRFNGLPTLFIKFLRNTALSIEISVWRNDEEARENEMCC
ncbi:hypothetical protein DMENIID0001_061270 [Sergentomyia squamirostris]